MIVVPGGRDGILRLVEEVTRGSHVCRDLRKAQQVVSRLHGQKVGVWLQVQLPVLQKGVVDGDGVITILADITLVTRM